MTPQDPVFVQQLLNHIYDSLTITEEKRLIPQRNTEKPGQGKAHAFTSSSEIVHRSNHVITIDQWIDVDCTGYKGIYQTKKVGFGYTVLCVTAVNHLNRSLNGAIQLQENFW